MRVASGNVVRSVSGPKMVRHMLVILLARMVRVLLHVLYGKLLIKVYSLVRLWHSRLLLRYSFTFMDSEYVLAIE